MRTNVQRRMFAGRLPWEVICSLTILGAGLGISVLWAAVAPGSMRTDLQRANQAPAFWTHPPAAGAEQKGDGAYPDGPVALPEAPVDVPSGSDSPWYECIFGTQGDGIDTFAYTVTAARRYLVPLIVLVLVVLLAGSCLGVFSGYYEGRWTASVADFSSNAVSVYPPLVLLILVVYVFPSASLLEVAVVFGLTEATRLGSLIRNKIIALKKEDFVEAAREMGLSDRRIILRHILWYNCRELLVIQSVFSMSAFLMIELYLGYLNKADRFDAWGELIGPLASRGGMSQHPWYILPSILVVIGIGAMYLLGDGLIRYFSREDAPYDVAWERQHAAGEEPVYRVSD